MKTNVPYAPQSLNLEKGSLVFIAYSAGALLLSQVPHNNEPSLGHAAVLNKAEEKNCFHALGVKGPKRVALNKYMEKIQVKSE